MSKSEKEPSHKNKVQNTLAAKTMTKVENEPREEIMLTQEI